MMWPNRTTVIIRIMFLSVFHRNLHFVSQMFISPRTTFAHPLALMQVTVIPRLRHLIASSRSRCCSVDCQRAGAAANNAVVHSPIRQDLSMMSAGASERSPIHILRGAVASTIAAVLLVIRMPKSSIAVLLVALVNAVIHSLYCW